MKNCNISRSARLVIVGVWGLFTACEDFVAEDVSQKVVVLNAPARQISTEHPDITFWWEPLEVKSSYRLQVVIPSFEQAASLVLDTLVADTYQLNTTLMPGRYAWRVRAENGTYRSAFSEVRSFTIEDSAPEVPEDSDGFLPNQKQ